MKIIITRHAKDRVKERQGCKRPDNHVQKAWNNGKGLNRAEIDRFYKPDCPHYVYLKYKDCIYVFKIMEVIYLITTINIWRKKEKPPKKKEGMFVKKKGRRFI